MGVAALPYVALVAAAGAQAYNTNQQAKKQDAALAEGIRQQSQTQRRASQQIDQSLADIAQSSPADEAAAAREGYQQAVRGTEQQAQAGQALSGLSSAYDAASRDASKTASGNVSNIASLLSRIDAPLQQRRGEGVRVGNLGTELSILSRTAQGQDQLARLKAAAIRRNPWIDAFAAGLQGYAGGAMGAGGSTAGTTASTLNSGTGVNMLGNGAQYAGYA